PVLTDLAAPVGELGDPAAKGLDRAGKLTALALDIGPDLVRAASRRTGCGTADGLTGPADVDVRGAVQRVPASKLSLVRRASSIARSGVGGAPARTARKAKKPAA